MSEQDQHLSRVRERIAAAIVEFSSNRKEFFADELRAYVTQKVERVAPGSPDRVLRDLRQKGVLNYRVISRSKSRYELLAANG